MAVRRKKVRSQRGPRRQRSRRGRPSRGRETSGNGAGRTLGPAVARAAALAERRFGVARLHDLQVDALEAVFAGRDTLAVLPTGYGKSLVYQLPAVLGDRPTVVVSPLLALMADQERSLRTHNVPVIRLDSTLKVAERRAALERLREGGRLVVLTTPETLDSHAEVFAAARPWLLCVDEAHCITEWGHDFRPAYLRLASARENLGEPQVLALTATATPRVREHIVERLGLRDPAVVTAPPHRENLRLEVELVSAGNKPSRLGTLLLELPAPTLVYCSTTVETDRLYGALSKTRIPCDRYHGKLGAADRGEAQKRFLKRGRPRVMIATSAFGMGIDKPDIRTLIHYQVPGSLEQYVQESGRAGRDGQPSRCLLLYDPADLDIQKHLQRQGRASPAQVRRVAEALEAWAGEERPVQVADLALSANVTQTIARSTATQLEELGVLERGERKQLVATRGPAELREHTRELVRKLETRRREDEERLEALDAYARTLECRSVFIRRYFGEEDPPTCGRCDRCAEAPPAERERPRRKGQRKPKKRKGGGPQAEAPPGERQPKKPRRKKRKRKEPRGSRTEGGAERPPDAARGGSGTPKKKRRRGGRKRRGKRARGVTDSSTAPTDRGA